MLVYIIVVALFREALGRTAAPFTQLRQQGCGGYIDGSLTRYGTIQSPGYPSQYPGDISCTWTIAAPRGQHIALSFEDFDITGSKSCSGDNVAISRTGDASLSDAVRLCGSEAPPAIMSQADTLLVEFVSNREDSCRGFKANFTVMDEIVTCGGSSSSLQFQITSPNYPENAPEEPSTCEVRVAHECDVEICQIRLDFDEFQLQPPVWGDCQFDQFYVDSAGGPIPTLCGMNDGTHMYIPVAGKSSTTLTAMLSQLESSFYNCWDTYDALSGSSGRGYAPAVGVGRSINRFIPTQPQYAYPVNVTVALANYMPSTQTTFPTRRAWKIRVTQIPCNCTSSPVPKAPEGCLQYYQGISGEIKGFNFDGFGCYAQVPYCKVDQMVDPSDCDMRVGFTGHLNNLDYSICVEGDSGFCGIQYTQVEPNSFSMSNVTELPMRDLPYAQSGDRECSADYLGIVNSRSAAPEKGVPMTDDRFCGTALGLTDCAGPIVSYNKPFVVRVVTDGDEYTASSDYMNRGFDLHYAQIPCKLSSG